MELSRRIFIAGSLAAVPVSGLTGAAPSSAPRLLTIPTALWKGVANPREKLVGWGGFVVLEMPDATPVDPIELHLSYRAAREIVREERLGKAALDGIALPNVPPSRLSGSEPAEPVVWPYAFRIVSQYPATPAIDAVAAKLRIRTGRETDWVVSGEFPIRDYAQKTKLIFPFQGPGIVSQGGLFSGGHRNRSGAFAVDALGLNETYGPMVSATDSGRPQDYAGWGRPIIAPADGIVVSARGDRPDQPKTDVSDPAYYAPEYPDGGDTGNSVVIDHGNGEFSMIAHLQAGSVRVAQGQKIVQGQTIGLLGNSGDSSGPHVHYQLQDGPRWEYSDGLPVQFDNVSALDRGSYFTAR